MTRLLDRLASVLAALNAPLCRAGRTLASLLIAIMLALAVAQILSRAILDHSLDWAEEVARFALVWSVLVIAPYAYRTGSHIAIGAFAEALPQKLLVAVSLGLNLLVAWVCWRCLDEGFSFWRRGLTMSATTLPMQLSWVYAVVPAAFALLLSVAAEFCLRLSATVLSGGAPRGYAMIGAVPGTDAEREA